MPLERIDESSLRYFWAPASLRSWAGGGDSQNIDSHVGRGSLHNDDGSVVEGSRVGPLRPAPAHSGYSFHDGMDVRLRGGIQIPAAQ
jgi:hypothetical protein